MDSSAVKQFFKDSDNESALAMYNWATAAMEVRGLISLPPSSGRKRRSDAGQLRGPQQQSLSGLPDEDQK